MKRRPLIVSLILGVVVLALIALGVRSCRKPPAPPPAPLSAAERTRKMVRERMADPAYSNGLVRLAARQAELAHLKNEAIREFDGWRDGFLASNAEARVVFDRIQEHIAKGLSPTNGLFAADSAKFEALVAADPGGRYLLGKRDAIQRAIDEHQAVIADFVSSRIRRQRPEAAAAEVAAFTALRQQMQAEGKIKPGPSPASPANRPEPRKRDWPTNALAARAAAAAAARQTNAPADRPGSAGILPAEPGRDEAQPSPEKAP